MTPAQFEAMLRESMRLEQLQVVPQVIATVACTGMLVSADTSAVAMPIPALGPSLGVAPSGTWMCTSRWYQYGIDSCGE